MVTLIKVKDLAGRRVLVSPVAISAHGVRPVWLQVTSVMDSAASENVGRYFYLVGRQVRKDGTPSTAKGKRRITGAWVKPSEIIGVIG